MQVSVGRLHRPCTSVWQNATPLVTTTPFTPFPSAVTLPRNVYSLALRVVADETKTRKRVINLYNDFFIYIDFSSTLSNTVTTSCPVFALRTTASKSEVLSSKQITLAQSSTCDITLIAASRSIRPSLTALRIYLSARSTALNTEGLRISVAEPESPTSTSYTHV